MAYFARQKRQTKTYWAELGFMALGLFGLQPGLFTSLLTPTASHLSAAASHYAAAYPSRPLSSDSEYWSSPSLTLAANLYGGNAPSWHPAQSYASSFAPAIQASQPSYLTAQHPLAASPSQVGAYAQQPLHSQPAAPSPYSASNYPQQHFSPVNAAQPYSPGQHAYAATQFNSNPSNTQSSYAQQAYGQQAYGLPASSLTNAYSPSHSLALQQNQQQHQPQYQPPVQPSYPQSPNTWHNSESYLAQANPGYSTPSSGASLYGNSRASSPTNTAYPPSNLSGSRTNPYSTLEPYSAQQSLFGSGTGSTAYSPNSYSNNSYSNYGQNAGSQFGVSTAQNYPYQTGAASGWQRYRASGSPLYR